MESIFDLFISLKRENIFYFILRDFLPVKSIENSKDIDLYVSLKDKKRIRQLLAARGWYHPKINTARYPHEQYIKIINGRLYKLDIVYALYYSDHLYHFSFENDIYRKEIDGVFVACPKVALVLFFLHIIYDKQELSVKNKNILKRLLEFEHENKNFNNHSNHIDVLYDKIFSKLSIDLLESNDFLLKYQNDILKEKIVSKNKVFEYRHRIHTKINNIIRRNIKRIQKNSLCLVGIDGSGKTQTIKNIETCFKGYIKVQYMGFKNYESMLAKKFYKRKNKNRFLEIFVVYYDMWYRYLKNRFKGKMVLYDRYVLEAFYNNIKIRKVLYFFLYYLFFPRPKKIIYLYCDANISLQRKDDIEDESLFRRMKTKTDAIYLSKKKVIAIDTGLFDETEVQRLVEHELNHYFLGYFI